MLVRPWGLLKVIEDISKFLLKAAKAYHYNYKVIHRDVFPTVQKLHISAHIS